jgi:hypothetical protein
MEQCSGVTEVHFTGAVTISSVTFVSVTLTCCTLLVCYCSSCVLDEQALNYTSALHSALHSVVVQQ